MWLLTSLVDAQRDSAQASHGNNIDTMKPYPQPKLELLATHTMVPSSLVMSAPMHLLSDWHSLVAGSGA